MCNYCSSNYFIGYDKQNSNYTLFSPAGSAGPAAGAPNSNGNTCSLTTQAVDVRSKLTFYLSFNTFLFKSFTIFLDFLNITNFFWINSSIHGFNILEN